MPEAAQQVLDEPLDQAAVIPYRWRNGQLEVCLITTRSKGKWGFPKGNIEAGDSYASRAAQEAFEEAGLIGEIGDEPIGILAFRKQSALRRAIVLPMHVQQCQKKWPEKRVRKRTWASLDDAKQLLCRPHLYRLLQNAVRHLQEQTACATLATSEEGLFATAVAASA